MAEKGGFTYNDQNQYGFAPGQEQNVPPQQYQNPPPYAPPSKHWTLFEHESNDEYSIWILKYVFNFTK